MIEKKKLHHALREMGKKHLKEPYKSKWTPERPTRGYCYVVAEVVYHHLAPEGSRPHMIRISKDETHWFVVATDGQIIDPTADQYDEPIPYEKATPHGFLTKEMSKRARILADLLGLSQAR